MGLIDTSFEEESIRAIKDARLDSRWHIVIKKSGPSFLEVYNGTAVFGFLEKVDGEYKFSSKDKKLVMFFKNIDKAIRVVDAMIFLAMSGLMEQQHD